MKRLLFLVVLGTLALSSSSCDASPAAATVNGVEISQSTLNGDLNQLASNSYALCASEIMQGGTISVAGVGTTSDGSTNAVTTTVAANELQSLIVDELYRQALTRHGATVTTADVEAATVDYRNQLSLASQNGTPCGLPASTLLDRLPDGFIQAQATALASQEKLAQTIGKVDVSTGALMSYYDNHLSSFNQPCLNLIVATSSAAAQAIHNAVAIGATFAEASQMSGVASNSPTDGEAPCVAPSAVTSTFGAQIATTIDALADGQLASPIPWTETSTATQYWLVVQMRGHNLVPFEQAESSIRTGLLTQSGAITDAETEVSRSARSSSVNVDPRYGTWSAAKGLSVPASPPAKFVPNPSANQPAPSSSPLGLGSGPSGGSGG